MNHHIFINPKIIGGIAQRSTSMCHQTWLDNPPWKSFLARNLPFFMGHVPATFDSQRINQACGMPGMLSQACIAGLLEA